MHYFIALNSFQGINYKTTATKQSIMLRKTKQENYNLVLIEKIRLIYEIWYLETPDTVC